MKILRPLIVAVVFVSLCAAALTAAAADTNTAKLKPYTLKTCIISGDKLGEIEGKLAEVDKLKNKLSTNMEIAKVNQSVEGMDSIGDQLNSIVDTSSALTDTTSILDNISYQNHYLLRD